MCDIFKNELLMLLNDKVDDNTLININNEIDIMLADYDISRSQSKTINLDDIKTLIDTYLMTLKARGLTINFNEMIIEQSKAYKASVEAYGTASELYEVEMRIKELLHNVGSK